MLGYCAVCGNKVPTVDGGLNYDDKAVCAHGCCDRGCCEKVDGCPDCGKRARQESNPHHRA